MRRREFLSMAVLLTGMAHGAPVLTPAQTEGPFFPDSLPSESDADLTRMAGSKARAKGQEVVVTGVVRDLDGQPIAGAQVEIWQACASGRYNHPRDPNPAALDPSFQYYGHVTTDKKGAYRFRTIKPGAYPAARGWTRPPHIHFKVRSPGRAELVTQMYFEGDDLLKDDAILQSLTPVQRKLVVVSFAPAESVPTGEFEIVLGRSGRYSQLLTPYLD
jgi:protocatechuate 3,4-dioxygenase, beta subunit